MNDEIALHDLHAVNALNGLNALNAIPVEATEPLVQIFTIQLLYNSPNRNSMEFERVVYCDNNAAIHAKLCLNIKKRFHIRFS